MMAQPYYIGNSIAIDMMNLRNNECSTLTDSDSHPVLKGNFSILSAGCGNLRHFIHTIVSLPSGFQGKLHTTLNDGDPFVQARNILFLFIMIVFAEKENISGIITSIWYSLHISETHYKFLTRCIQTLVGMDKNSLVQALGGVVDLLVGDIDHVKQVWQKWLQLECRRRHKDYINLTRQRKEMFSREEYCSRAVEDYKKELDGKYVASFDEWIRDGIFLPKAGERKKYLEYGNPTLTGFKHFRNELGFYTTRDPNAPPSHIKFQYCIQPDLHPFGEWDYSLVRRFSASNSLIDMYFAYIKDQIQQGIVCLSTQQFTVTFSVGNCLEIRDVLEGHKFDRIFTSNIADTTGTQTLLENFKPFLNQSNKFATIVNQYWKWYLMFPQAVIDNPDSFEERMLDGSYNKARERSMLDTGKLKDFPANFQEYFNSTDYFVAYLRVDTTLSNMKKYVECMSFATSEAFLPFRNVQEASGLRMRDFRRGLNKVVPFQYRRNVRHVSMLRGHMSRMVEWYLPR